MLFKTIEIAVPVQEFVTFRNAECGDQTVHRLAYGDPAPLQDAEVLGRGNRQLSRCVLEDGKRKKPLFGLPEMPVKANAAQNLTQNQAGQPNLLLAQCRIQPESMRRALGLKRVYPYAAVDNHHLTFSSFAYRKATVRGRGLAVRPGR